MTHANDNGPPIPAELHPDFGDGAQMLNMRGWLQKACEAKGAKMLGGGVGMGDADIDIELEGHRYNVRIRPLMRRGASAAPAAGTV